MENNIILSIIIPSYKETEQQIMPLLSSISNQVNINLNTIEIILVRDGTFKLDLDKFNLLNLSINQILTKENRGPGLARQTGLDYATGKYIMFCDADDVLQNVGILSAMLHEISTNDLDILKTAWLEESLVQGSQQYVYTRHNQENTWMHGKIFKHQFLIDNNIKFHPNLRVHEDTYFLGICAEYTKKIGFLNTLSYIWKWGNNSITRKNNGEYRFKQAVEFLKACVYIQDKIRSRPLKYQENLTHRMVQLVIYQYFILHSQVWKNQPEAIYEVENKLIELLTPYWDVWLNADLNYITELYNSERKQHFSNHDMEFETLEEWLNRLNLPFRKKID